MRHSQNNKTAIESQCSRLAGEEFPGLFVDQFSDLYELALLLTTNPEAAQACLVSGLEDSADENPAFRNWAHHWARRVVIRNAVRIMLHGEQELEPLPSSTGSVLSILKTAPQLCNPEVARVLSLETMERFVYVLTVLEAYSCEETALLLEVPLEVIQNARERATQQIAAPNADGAQTSPAHPA